MKLSFRLLGDIIKPFLKLLCLHEYITSEGSFFLQSGSKLYLALHATAVYLFPRAIKDPRIKENGTSVTIQVGIWLFLPLETI